MRSSVLLCACLALLAGSAACDKREEGRITVAVVPKGTSHEFWKSIHAGAIKASKELDVDIIWKGPINEDNRNDQIDVVDSFITRRVSGIVIAPLDDTALVGPIERATDTGIPVVIIDSGLKSEKYVSFIATDNFKGGVMAGKRMVELLGGKGKVAMLRYAEGHASTTKREEGFMSVVTAEKGLEVVSSDQRAGATAATANVNSENLLEALKSTGVDGIYCPNESSTFGMLRALQQKGMAGKVKFVGFDSSPKLVEALRNDEIHGLIVQNPMQMGYLGVKTMVRHLKGEKVEKMVDTGAVLVTRENMDKPDIKELISPDLDKWLKDQ